MRPDSLEVFVMSGNQGLNGNTMRTPRLTGLVLAVLIASQVVAMADRVMMNNGSSFEVRGFKITDGVVTVALSGRTWSVPSELVDLEGTRQANGMSSTDMRSPGWSRGSEPIVESREPETDKTVTPEPSASPETVAFAEEETLEEPEDGPLIALAEAKIDDEEAMARAKAEYEEAMRSLAREQEQLNRRVEELEIAKAAQEETLDESEAEPSTAQAEAKADYEEKLAKVIADYEEAIRLMAKAQEELERRVKELEAAKTAQEEATRQIIRDATSTSGSKINQFVALGGNFELAAGWLKGTSGRSQSIIELATAEIDFEVQANDWTLGSIILEYDNGKRLFRTLRGFEVDIDRINIDTAFVTIGDPQRLPPFATVGRIVLPFGISTGDPVADVLTLEDPLTIEVFEMRETAVLVGAGFPTPPLTPASPPVAPPPVKPIALNPFFKSMSKGLGYDPPPTRPPPPTLVTPTPAPPPLSVGFVVFQGATSAANDGRFNFGATAGFVKKWDCDRPYDDGWSLLACPFSIDVDFDYNSSVFDSRFLGFEYLGFLDQIGYVPGMASSVKATIGALSFVGEWNGAIDNATFIDDSGTLINMKPSAWQVSFAFQFDWNPWVNEIGAQGSYLAFSYSRSQDLAGFTRDGERAGFAPWRRFSLSAGEWVMDHLRLAVDYSRNVDYPLNQGGSGNSADGILLVVTYVW